MAQKFWVGAPKFRIGAPKFRVGAPKFRVGAPKFRVGAPKFGIRHLFLKEIFKHIFADIFHTFQLRAIRPSAN